MVSIQNKKHLVGLALFLFLLGTVIGSLIAFNNPRTQPASKMTSGQIVNLFTNPTITEESQKHFIINFKPLKDELTKIRATQPQKTYIYFAYLNNSSWVGLGEKDMFTAASTVKVPLSMAVMRAVETGKLKLTDSYALSDLDLDANFGQLYQVGSDQESTVEELLKIMLKYSDNTAMQALFTVMSNIGIENPLLDVYTAMGWDTSADTASTTFQSVTPKALSNMFLSLYNDSYLTANHSNQILDYLSQSPFDTKIVSGVPAGIAVSHKIGTYDTNQTYSDCGIVYAPSRNYILCVVSVGVPEDKAAAFISAVSKAVYQYVINH